jgi:hypothetical protein
MILLIKMNFVSFVIIFALQIFSIKSIKDECIKEGILSKETLTMLTKRIVPDLNRKSKGDAGRIGIIGGSIEYTGAPYFAALTSLKVRNNINGLFSYNFSDGEFVY